MLRTFQFRLLPNATQRKALDFVLVDKEAYHLLYQLADHGRNSLTQFDEWEAIRALKGPRAEREAS